MKICHNPGVRLVFFGTPDFAVPTLDALAREHEIALVVAQPDRPAGRGMKLQAPAVAVRARELGLPLVQPSKIRTEEFLDSIRLQNADAGIVIAYGRILPGTLLAIPRHGFLNVHASILPSWRGAAPIQRAIEAGDRLTGVSIMRVDEELDHGPTFAIETTPITPDERAPALAERLAHLGATALLRVLAGIENGTSVETEQDHDRATFAAKLEKSEGEVDFTERALTIYDRFRAFDLWPGLYFRTSEEVIKLNEIRPSDGSGEPGEVLEVGESVRIAAGAGAIEVLEMQRPGRSRMPAGPLARSLGWSVGGKVRS